MEPEEQHEATEQPIASDERFQKYQWRIEGTRRWTDNRVLLNGQPVEFHDLGLYIAQGQPGPEMWLQVERAMVHGWNAEGDLDLEKLYPPVPGHPTVLTLGLLPHRVVFEGFPIVYIRVGNRRFRVIEETAIGGLFDGL